MILSVELILAILLLIGGLMAWWYGLNWPAGSAVALGLLLLVVELFLSQHQVYPLPATILGILWFVLILIVFFALEPQGRGAFLISYRWVFLVSFALLFFGPPIYSLFDTIGELVVGKEGVTLKRREEAIKITKEGEKFIEDPVKGARRVIKIFSALAGSKEFFRTQLFYLQSQVKTLKGSAAIDLEKHITSVEASIDGHDDLKKAMEVVNNQKIDLNKLIIELQGLTNRGDIEAAKSKGKEIESLLRSKTAVGKGLQTPSYYVLLGNTYRMLEKRQELLKTLYEGISKFPANLTLHNDLAYAFLTLEDYSRATFHWEKCLALAPLIQKEIQENYQYALDTSEKLKDVKFKNQIANHQMTYERTFMDNVEEFKVQAKNNLAYVYALDGVQELLAKDYAQEAHQFDNENPYYLDTLGFVNYRFARTSNDVREALGLFEKAVNLARKKKDAEIEKLALRHREAAFRDLARRPREEKPAPVVAY